MNSPVARAFIWAAKQAKDRAALNEWMAVQKPRMQRFLPDDEAMVVIEETRKLWRSLEAQQ